MRVDFILDQHSVNASIAQLAEQGPFKPWVRGSSPRRGTVVVFVLWPHGVHGLRISDFQSEGLGSIPNGATNGGCRGRKTMEEYWNELLVLLFKPSGKYYSSAIFEFDDKQMKLLENEGKHGKTGLQLEKEMRKALDRDFPDFIKVIADTEEQSKRLYSLVLGDFPRMYRAVSK